MYSLLRLRWLMSWRYLLSHPAQLLLAIIGITTGVAAVIAVDATRQLVSASFQQNLQQLQTQSTHTLEHREGGISYTDYARLRREYPEIVFAPSIRASARIRLANDDIQQVTVFGVDLISEAGLVASANSLGTTGGFNKPLDNNQDIDTSTIDMAGWLGGEALAMVSENLQSLLPKSIVGYTSESTLDDSTKADQNAENLETASSVVLLHGEHVSRLNIAGQIPADMQLGDLNILVDLSLIQRLFPEAKIELLRLAIDSEQATILNQKLNVQFGDQWRLSSANQNPSGMAAAFSMNMLAMGLLALLMGALLVYSTFRLLLLQRERLHELQYVLGDGRPQILSQLLLEALLLGVMGTALGLLAGLGLASLVLAWLQNTLGDLFASSAASLWEIDSRLIALSLVAGLGSSLLALIPLALGQIQVAKAWQHIQKTRQQPTLWLIAACMILGFSGWHLIIAYEGLVTALAGLFAMTLAYLLLAIPGLRWLGQALQKACDWSQWLSVVAVRRLRTSIRRTSPALIALILALATIVGVSSMVDSFRGSVDDWLDITLSAPAYLLNGGEPVSITMLNSVRAHPKVQAMSWLQTTDAMLNGRRGEISIIDLPTQGEQSYRMLSGQSLWQAAQAQSKQTGPLMAMLGETLAQRQGIKVGDNIEVELNKTGLTTTLEIVGVFQDYRAGPGRAVVLRNAWLAADLPLAAEPTSIGLYLDAEQLPNVSADLESQTHWRDAYSIVSSAEIKRETLRIFDQTFLLTRSLRWIVAIVALVGVCGALLALQLERRQELGLMHTLGTKYQELRWLVIAEALLLGLLAIVLAMPLGALLAWLLCEVVNLRAFGWHIDTVILPSHWLLAILVGVGASLMAALLAARLSIKPAENNNVNAIVKA